MDHPTPSSRNVSAGLHCEHLRHKGMYVLSVPDPAELAFYDAYDATAYWCTKTQKPLGPDGRPVHAAMVALSEHYNAVLADHLTDRLGLVWASRDRGVDRNAG